MAIEDRKRPQKRVHANCETKVEDCDGEKKAANDKEMEAK